MINKFKDIFIGKKKLDQNSSFNFPINEKSLDLNLNEASFLTYHSQVNQSFHSSDIQTMNTDADSQENGVENFNQNFTSILNVPPPKTNRFIVELYNILSESIKSSLNQSNSNFHFDFENLNVPLSSFQNYISSIKSQYEFYIKSIKIKQFEENDIVSHINVNQILLNCYENVPTSFFDESFIFNFLNLSRNIRKMNEIQENFSEYLDEIELSLFYQITTRFQTFLDVILNLNKMESEIDSAIQKIKNLRKYQNSLNEKLLKPSENILLKKKKCINIEKTINMMELLKVVRMTVPTLESLIHSENYDFAVNLVHQSDKTYMEKLKLLLCLKNFYPVFKQAKIQVEDTLANLFIEKSINYMQSFLLYNKNYDFPMIEESFINTTVINENDSSLNLTMNEDIHSKLLWSFQEIRTNKELEAQISKIVVNLIRIKEFSARNYKLKILEILRSLNKKILKDIVEYYEFLNKNEEKTEQNGSESNHIIVSNLNDITSKLNYTVFQKIVIFYFQLFKRFIERQISINNKIITEVIIYFESITETTCDISQNTAKILLDLSEDIFSIINMTIKFMSDKLTETINRRKIEELSVSQFKQLINIFEMVKNWVTVELNHLMIDKDKEINIPSLKSLLNKYNSYFQKISTVSLINLQIEREKTFIILFHKKKQENLRESLENEYWQPTDIPYQYINIISYIANENRIFKEYDNVEFAEEILISSRLSHDNQKNLLEKSEEKKNNVLSEMENEKTNESKEENQNLNEDFKKDGILKEEELDSPLLLANKIEKSKIDYKELKMKIGENLVKIMKNELYVDKKKFFLTSSALLLLKIIYDYLHIVEYFPSIAYDSVVKLFEIVKFFNSYTCQLVLGAGAVHFEKIKMITARILAIASLSLSLIKFLMDKINGRIENLSNFNKEWLVKEINIVKNDLKNTSNEIFNKIINILNERLLINVRGLKDLEWSNKMIKITIPTEYSQNIFNNTKQMYNTIQDYFLMEDLVTIFSAIVNDIMNNYLVFFYNLKIETKIDAMRVKDELEYFYQNMIELPFFDLIKEKRNIFVNKTTEIIRDNCNNFIQMTSLN